MAERQNSNVDAVVNLAKRRGFVFASSEIYGGTRSAWDYGPLGVELKENIRRQWWRSMVRERDDVVGLDSSIILAPQVWEASGHVNAFADPLTECKNCHKRFRADQLLDEYENKHNKPAEQGLASIGCAMACCAQQLVLLKMKGRCIIYVLKLRREFLLTFKMY